jgi:hypothetical protein
MENFIMRFKFILPLSAAIAVVLATGCNKPTPIVTTDMTPPAITMVILQPKTVPGASSATITTQTLSNGNQVQTVQTGTAAAQPVSQPVTISGMDNVAPWTSGMSVLVTVTCPSGVASITLTATVNGQPGAFQSIDHPTYSVSQQSSSSSKAGVEGSLLLAASALNSTNTIVFTATTTDFHSHRVAAPPVTFVIPPMLQITSFTAPGTPFPASTTSRTPSLSVTIAATNPQSPVQVNFTSSNSQLVPPIPNPQPIQPSSFQNGQFNLNVPYTLAALSGSSATNSIITATAANGNNSAAASTTVTELPAANVSCTPTLITPTTADLVTAYYGSTPVSITFLPGKSFDASSQVVLTDEANTNLKIVIGRSSISPPLNTQLFAGQNMLMAVIGALDSNPLAQLGLGNSPITDPITMLGFTLAITGATSNAMWDGVIPVTDKVDVFVQNTCNGVSKSSNVWHAGFAP